MPLLFKNPENVIRRIETIDPNINPSNDREYSATLQPSVNEIPLVFGKALVTPVPIFKIDGPEEFLGFDGEATKSKMIFYALSANTHNREIFSGGDFIENIYIDGTLVTGAVTISPNTGDRGPTVDWKEGKTASTNGALGACLNAGGPSSNFGGNTGRFRQNVYFGFVKAGSDFTEHAFWETFGGAYADGRPYPNMLQGGFPDNKDFDMLVVFYKFNKQYFSNENPDLQVTYQRYPRFKSGESNTPDARYTPTVGNCILEILDNSEWGMGLRNNAGDYEYNDFKNVGPLMAGVFSISNKPLIEILRTIDGEQTDRQLFEQEGRLRYAATNDSGLTITDDNIIEEIEVQYPDSTVAPTKLIATYESFVGGSTEIEIGTDNTNVVSINLYTATDLASAQTLATKIWNQFNNTITITFRADKSMHQFGLRDVVDLSTQVFSATDCIIVDMVQNPDYTFNMTLEADAGTAAPTPILRSKTPVIQIGDGLYRPPDQEIDGDFPPSPRIINPVNYKIISGLEHPYNFNTGSVNTAWYLGGTTDGTTKDTRYDANGLRTRFIRNQGGGATYTTDYSLIWRNEAAPAPTAIIYAADNGMTAAERASNPVGVGLWNKGKMQYRFKYPGFFNDVPQAIKINNGTSWVTSFTTWPTIYSTNPTYPGGLDPFEQNDNQLDYVFQVGEIDYGNPYNYRYVHTLDSDTFYRPSSNRFFMIDPLMKRSGVYRLHFTAIFGDVRSPERVEYIGSTSMWGDERSIQDADEGEAIATGAYFGKVYTPNYTAPPDRDLT